MADEGVGQMSISEFDDDDGDEDASAYCSVASDYALYTIHAIFYLCIIQCTLYYTVAVAYIM